LDSRKIAAISAYGSATDTHARSNRPQKLRRVLGGTRSLGFQAFANAVAIR
jgi:hypothetical protein